MTKRSRYEQAQRAAEQERIRDIEAGWAYRLAPSALATFASEVAAAQTRERVRQPDMAPGTKPNPPRPGREPRTSKDGHQTHSRG